jgi:septal ring factor EnvC (AmiA/AmiB activator)
MFGSGFVLAIEPIMYFGIGFFVASLFAVGAVAAAHSRAVRITTRKLDSAVPISMKDIQSEKDVLRAEFAMTARRLESSIEELKGKANAHVAELGKKANVITKLKLSLDEKVERIAALEDREKQLEERERSLFEELQASKNEIIARSETIRDLERAVVAAKVEYAELQIATEHRMQLFERQRTEIVALKSHIDTVRRQVADFANDFHHTQDQLSHQWVELKTVDEGPIVLAGTHHPSNGLNGGHGVNGAKALNGQNGAVGNGLPNPASLVPSQS